MSAKKYPILALTLGLGLASGAHAAGIMDALSLSSNSVNPLNNTLAAESFVADSSGIGDVEMYLSETSTLTNGSIAVTVRADNANKPATGTPLDTIQVLNESQIPATQTLFDFYNLPINNLTSGTKYWIQVAKMVGSSVSTETFTTPPSNLITGNAATTSNPGDTAYAVGTNSGATTRVMTLCVSDDNACDAGHPVAVANAFNVPEPAGLAILAAGLLGLASARRRHQPA